MNTFFKACRWFVILVSPVIAGSQVARAQEAKRSDVLIADFEAETYGDWKAEGEAFGSGPAEGTLAGQMRVSGFEGKRLVNSFFNGDRTTGTLTSPEFTIQRPWINFLIGGGGHEGQTCMNLLVDGKVVRTEPGANTVAGGSEELQPASWDVADLVGKTTVLRMLINPVRETERLRAYLPVVNNGLKSCAGNLSEDPTMITNSHEVPLQVLTRMWMRCRKESINH